MDAPLIGEPIELSLEGRFVPAVEEERHCEVEPEGMYIRAVDAAERQVGIRKVACLMVPSPPGSFGP